MSGAGRKHRAKHLVQAHDEKDYDLEDGEEVMKLLDIRGNHYQVEDVAGKELLVRLPAKFNKVVWIKRGDLVVVSRENDDETDTGVVGLINHRLSKKQVKTMVARGAIGSDFAHGGAGEPNEDKDEEASPRDEAPAAAAGEGEEEYEDSEDEDDPWMRGNPNQAPAFDEADDEDEETDD
eukprot:TRINITY_DN196_c0_g2_i1.p5 TRINITY_DN196_c0_g2~~TRINITY_DN196_c0_g2_i1.p5  ORF type:complete len:179 (+),score=75.05 TRINITY_DN196_c0_g2_i1:52-588(+)